MQVLRHPPPYGLVVYVEPGYPDMLQESRSVILVGKALLKDGHALSVACEDQWNKERAKYPWPRDRISIRAKRGEGTYAGWEAKRSLHDGTVLRLRALCGNTDVGTAFVFLSAPDQSSLYEPVWERLLLMNLGDARER